ncbi:MAG: hypothetical protein FWD77_01460 [Betaproteobacteria bacterium]|nr:hypothetical protein [Betaproteobacteria bacterium]
MPTPNPAELKAAFQRCGLWRLGWSFERAIHTPSLRIALTCAANALRKRAEREGHPTPEQHILKGF